LAPLTDLAHSVLASAGARPANESTADNGKHDEELAERLAYANVRVQVANVCVAEPVLRTWATKTRPLWVHGLVYDVGSGRLKDLNVTRGSP
jgi:carbonic anhydrase